MSCGETGFVFVDELHPVIITVIRMNRNEKEIDFFILSSLIHVAVSDAYITDSSWIGYT